MAPGTHFPKSFGIPRGVQSDPCCAAIAATLASRGQDETRRWRAAARCAVSSACGWRAAETVRGRAGRQRGRGRRTTLCTSPALALFPAFSLGPARARSLSLPLARPRSLSLGLARPRSRARSLQLLSVAHSRLLCVRPDLSPPSKKAHGNGSDSENRDGNAALAGAQAKRNNHQNSGLRAARACWRISWASLATGGGRSQVGLAP